ncbi:MAG TPA: hypothetical protein VHE78_00405 [Gemmatimonadaceae bacterium]|nr:hypothetical protein [Gemmatimonadaceae bacterium]
MIRLKSRLITLALVGFALVAGRAAAQSGEDIRKQFLLPIPDVSKMAGPGTFFRGSPGTNLFTPLAFAPGWGDVFFDGDYQAETRGTKGADGTFTTNGGNDGAVSGGFGIGNSAKAVSLETVITTLSTFRSGWFNRTAFSFKVSRLLNNTSAIAVGVENAFIAGGGKTDGTDSWYAVVSKVFQLPNSADRRLFRAVTLSGGLGNGRFLLLDDLDNNKRTVNIFGSASVLIHDQLSVIGDYSGQDVNVGVSIVPFTPFPVVFTPIFSDLTRTASKSPRFTLSVGIGMKFN